ncbi:hypothetical protein GA0074695_2534 [Micromonospora viridifaciens]|uniref:Uncharacterized protein n=1 Tax=Micromonospora viridifaciens TaxID=1881 RepID=A0A1C4WKR6_MICVI|nr:hypothetical protein GA0074695_2534 [Micromonospora viridifaciens]
MIVISLELAGRGPVAGAAYGRPGLTVRALSTPVTSRIRCTWGLALTSAKCRPVVAAVFRAVISALMTLESMNVTAAASTSTTSALSTVNAAVNLAVWAEQHHAQTRDPEARPGDDGDLAVERVVAAFHDEYLFHDRRPSSGSIGLMPRGGRPSQSCRGSAGRGGRILRHAAGSVHAAHLAQPVGLFVPVADIPQPDVRWPAAGPAWRRLGAAWSTRLPTSHRWPQPAVTATCCWPAVSSRWARGRGRRCRVRGTSRG